MTQEEKFKRLKGLADAMYTAAQYLSTDASSLRRAMADYYRFTTFELPKEGALLREETSSADKEAVKEIAKITSGEIIRQVKKAIKSLESGLEKPVEKYDCPAISVPQAVEVTSRVKHIKENLIPIANFILEYVYWDLHKDEWSQCSASWTLSHKRVSRIAARNRGQDI